MPVRTNIRIKVGPVATTVAADSGFASTKSDPTVCLGQPGHDAHDPIPRKQPYVCPECGPIVDTSRTAKARQIDGKWHLLPAEEATALSKEVSAQFLHPAFTPSPREQVDAATVPGKAMYVLTPISAADSANYANIRSMVREHPELSFVSFFTPKSAAGVYALEVRGDALVLVERQRQVDMKPLPAIDAQPDAFESLCVSAVDGMVVDFDPEAYTNQAAVALAGAFAASTDTAAVVAAPRAEAAAAAPATDMEAELSKLVAAAKKTTPARTAAAKKVAAKKTTARKKVAA